MVSAALLLALALKAVPAVQATPAEAFRARVVVEEAGEATSYDVYFGEGTIRIDPPESPQPTEPPQKDAFVLIDIAAPALTLVYPDESCYYRLEPPEHRRLIEMGVLSLSWFPWVTPVSADLMEGVSLESRGHARLPDGRDGLRYEGTSPTYDRVVAAYTVDPGVAPELFFQWHDVYFELWGEGEPGPDDPQRKRFALHDALPGLPVVSEERFSFLSRPRTTRIESREPIPEGALTIPEEYEEGDVRELYWESLGERLLRQFGLKEIGSALCAGSGH